VIRADLRVGAAEVLRRCVMPEDEIRWVLTAHDPAVVHMILELHREWLEEELAERRQALGELDAWLTERMEPTGRVAAAAQVGLRRVNRSHQVDGTPTDLSINPG
jgi:hypothetical protein